MKNIKNVIFLMVLGTMTACTSAQKIEEGKVTCLEKNKKYDDVVTHGTVCEDKEDPKERFYNDVELD